MRSGCQPSLGVLDSGRETFPIRWPERTQVSRAQVVFQDGFKRGVHNIVRAVIPRGTKAKLDLVFATDFAGEGVKTGDCLWTSKSIKERAGVRVACLLKVLPDLWILPVEPFKPDTQVGLSVGKRFKSLENCKRLLAELQGLRW